MFLAAAAALPAVALLAALTSATWSPHWPGWSLLLLGVIVSPVLEEVVFRAGIQDGVAARWAGRFGVFTFANVATALVFCLMHLWRHPPAWALATLVPALVLGLAYERQRRLIAPIGLHAIYNLAYFVLLAGA